MDPRRRPCRSPDFRRGRVRRSRHQPRYDVPAYTADVAAGSLGAGSESPAVERGGACLRTRGSAHSGVRGSASHGGVRDVAQPRYLPCLRFA